MQGDFLWSFYHKRAQVSLCFWKLICRKSILQKCNCNLERRGYCSVSGMFIFSNPYAKLTAMRNPRPLETSHFRSPPFNTVSVPTFWSHTCTTMSRIHRQPQSNRSKGELSPSKPGVRHYALHKGPEAPTQDRGKNTSSYVDFSAPKCETWNMLTLYSHHKSLHKSGMVWRACSGWTAATASRVQLVVAFVPHHVAAAAPHHHVAAQRSRRDDKFVHLSKHMQNKQVWIK